MGASGSEAAGRARVVIAHDYLTQRGGAERVVLAMARAFPTAPIVTSLYEAPATFSDFAHRQVTTSVLQRSGLLRRHHRLGLPLYAPVFAHTQVDAELVVASTSGWAHGMAATGRRLLYVHNTARWLYQVDDYLRGQRPAVQGLAHLLGSPLRRWDRAHGRSAELVLANSRTVRDRVARHWNVDAEVLYPPHAADVAAPREAVGHIEPGYLLVVSRLVAHKQVDVVARAMEHLPGQRLVVVGTGPEARGLRHEAPPNCSFVGSVSDAQLRWLYANCAALVSASREDLGLAALEAMAFGRPVCALRAAGFAETVAEGENGVFFERSEPQQVRDAVVRLSRTPFDAGAIAAHAARFDEQSFARRLQAFADQVLA
ncbi:MAG TPA: glycosyltransferase [Acidimicrobiales bacterium]